MKSVKKFLLPAGIIAAAMGVAYGLQALQPQVQKKDIAAQLPPVEVVLVHADAMPAEIHATGVVRPAREVTMTPEVSGRVVWLSPSLLPGGRFGRGEAIAKIDPRDYELAIQQQRGAVRKAEFELQIELSRQGIAKREWDLLGRGAADAATADLALRKPHLAVAQTAVEAAKSALASAELALARTTIVAPFNASVVEEAVEVGQVVGPSSALAKLIGTDHFWVTVSVPVEDVGLLQLPKGDTPGSPVTVSQRLQDGSTITRKGRLLRLIEQLDAQSRRAQVLLQVADPLASMPPLLPGAYVSARIQGALQPRVYSIPRTAIYEGRALWSLDERDRLKRRLVDVLWDDDEMLFATGDLQDGERVVVSPLSLPFEGKSVRVQKEKTAQMGPE